MGERRPWGYAAPVTALLLILSCGLPRDGLSVLGAERLFRVPDLDGDGAADFVAASDVAEGANRSLRIYLYLDGLPVDAPFALRTADSDPAGGAGESWRLDLPARGGLGWDLTSADLDGDGKEDLAVHVCGDAGEGASCLDGGDLYVYWGSTPWSPEATVLAGVLSSGLEAAGDLDADGADDLLLPASLEGRTGVLRGSTDRWAAGFTAGAQVELLKRDWDAARPVGDVDGDGLGDLVVQVGCEVHLVPGRAGWVGGPVQDALAATAAVGGLGALAPVPVADVDGDGRTDWVGLPGGAADCAGSIPGSRAVLVTGGAPGLTGRDLQVDVPQVVAAPGFTLVGVVGVSADGQDGGDLVVALAGDGGGVASLGGVALRAAGSGGVEAAPRSALEGTVVGVDAVGDVDGDGTDEVAVLRDVDALLLTPR